jgi:hypothetical protein
LTGSTPKASTVRVTVIAVFLLVAESPAFAAKQHYTLTGRRTRDAKRSNSVDPRCNLP